jgi:hypothetical protein
MAGAAGRRRRLGAAAAVAVALVAVALALHLAPGSSSSSPARGADAGALAGPVTGVLRVPPPQRLRPDGAVRWADVLRPVTARRVPGTAAPAVARLGTRTPEGTGNLVVVDGRAARAASGEAWVRVRLPVLPNGTTGWVPRAALGAYTFVRTRLDVDLRRLRATLYDGGRVLLRAPVGVGAPGAPTPRGRFYVRNRLLQYRSRFYGPVAFGTSARSAVLTDWPAGGFVGIHGTDRPDLLPGRVSHGCIRLRNADMLRLSRLMPVGTPLTIH